MPPGWELTATSFSWVRELMRAQRSAAEVVGGIVSSGLVRHVEVELGQVFRTFPSVTEQEVAEVRGAVESGGGAVSNVALSLDDWLTPARRRSPAQLLAFVEPQLRAARALGATGAVLPFGQPGPELLASLVPLLDELDLVLYQEIQGPHGPGSPGFDETIEQLGLSPRLQVMLDTSMVMPALPVTYLERLAVTGFPADLLRRISQEWPAPDTQRAVREHVFSGQVGEDDLPLVVSLVVRFGNRDVADLEPLLPHVGAVQLKVWDLDDADGRVSRPLAGIGAALRRHGFAGTLASEWGGHDWWRADPAAVTREHLALATRVVSEERSARAHGGEPPGGRPADGWQLAPDALRRTGDGLELRLGSPWLRGLPVSCVRGLEIEVDAEVLAADRVRVRLGGAAVLLDALADRDEWWFPQDRLVALLPDLPGMEHDVEVRIRLMLPYLSAGPDRPAELAFRVRQRLRTDAPGAHHRGRDVGV